MYKTVLAVQTKWLMMEGDHLGIVFFFFFAKLIVIVRQIFFIYNDV